MEYEVKFADFIELKTQLADSKERKEIQTTKQEMINKFHYDLNLKYPLDALSDNYDIVFFNLHNKKDIGDRQMAGACRYNLWCP